MNEANDLLITSSFSIDIHLCVTRPSEIFVIFVFKHIHAASIYTICRTCVPFFYCSV